MSRSRHLSFIPFLSKYGARLSFRLAGLLLLLAVKAVAAGAQSGSTAQPHSSDDPNGLFVDAVMLYGQAASEPPEKQAETYLRVRAMLDHILNDHPDTALARTIGLGGAVGGIDLDQLALVDPYGWNDGKRRSAETMLAAYNQDEARLRQVAAAAEFALLACATYSQDGLICQDENFGNPTVDLRELGWKAEGFARDLQFVGEPVGFLYTHNDGQAVLAFRGSDKLLDFVTNVVGTVDPGFLTTAQLDFAKDEALRAVAAHPDLIIVGHSLGGRMAQVGSLATGRPAVVFNSAPIGAWETIRYPQSLTGQNELVQRFRSPDDPVSILVDETVGVSMPAKHIDVSNIAQTGDTQMGNLAGAKLHGYVHSMPVLSGGIAEVARIVDKGWLDALLREQERKRTEERASTLLGPLPDSVMANSTASVGGEVMTASTPIFDKDPDRWIGNWSGTYGHPHQLPVLAGVRMIGSAAAGLLAFPAASA